MLRPPSLQVVKRQDSVGILQGAKLPRSLRDTGISQPRKVSNSCRFEMPLDSIESKCMNSSDYPHETSGDTEGESSEGTCPRPSLRRLVRWSSRQERPIYMTCSEFEMGNNCFDVNNSGQGVDMQNLPSIAEQVERQKTWMTLNFRYRINWYEAKPVLSKMSREVAYRSANLPLWTRCVKIQLHRKTNFLNGIRAFRNRIQCATSGVRFSVYAFYRELGRRSDLTTPRSSSRSSDFAALEARPLPYFKRPDDMPDIKTMVVAQLNVFVSNSRSFFDQFWDECLKEKV